MIPEESATMLPNGCNHSFSKYFSLIFYNNDNITTKFVIYLINERFCSDSGGFYCLLFIFFSVWSFLVLGFLGSDLRLGYFLEFVLFFSDEKVGEWKRKKNENLNQKTGPETTLNILRVWVLAESSPFFLDILVTDFKFGCFSWIYPLVGCWENGEKKRQRAEISPVLMLLGRGLTLGDFLESILCLLAEEMEVKKMKMKIRIWKMTRKWS